MMNDSTIPLMNKPADVMSAGVNSNNLQSAARQRHPVDQLQRQQGTLDTAICLCRVCSRLFPILISSFLFPYPISIPISIASQKASFFGTTEEEDVRRIYGAGMAMQLATERRMALEMGGRGVAGLPSSNMMFEILSGNDMKLGFEDTLNLPDHRPIFSRAQEDPHAAMERKLGM